MVRSTRLHSRTAVAVLAVLSLALSAHAQSYDETTLRLSTIARVWGAVKFAHPYLGYREDIDWDAAGVRAAERARGSDPLPDVISEMLGGLGDPVTRVASECVASQGAPAKPGFTEVADGIIVIPIDTLTGLEIDASLANAVRTARHVLFDLRTPVGRCGTPALTLAPQIETLLIRGPVVLPSQRRVLHRGYRSQDPELDGGYRSSFVVEPGATVAGSGSATGAGATFLVDTRTSLPAFAWAMVFSGRGNIVSAGPFDERSFVSTIEVPIGDGYRAIVRSSELTAHGNVVALNSTALPATASLEAMVDAALDSLTPRRRRSVGAVPPPLPDYLWRAEEAYPSMQYPSFGYRALAAFRLWNIIKNFYAYLHLIGDWDARLPEVIEMLTSANSQVEYDLALARAMTFVPDGHSGVYSPSFMTLRGTIGPPFALMPVEGKPVVVELIDATAAGPVALGDELTAIDGRPVSERYVELEQYVSASTDAARAYYVTASLPMAATPSTAVFSFRRPGGETYDVTLERKPFVRVAPAKPWRILEGNIGYADLRWLEIEDVDQMFNELMGTRALIIDIRNYPRGVFPLLARRLNTKGSGQTSQIRVPRLVGGVQTWEESIQDLRLPPLTNKYTAPVIALINERAQSQSEHTCLVLEAVNGTRFVGSPTVGANGNISIMMMPGGIRIMFGGMDVRHLDGRQLQRVGILPDVDVPRTIEAFRNGRDEVLERAVTMLSQ
jgi:C-terminal processing protease CtpA/Prc